MSTHKRLSKEYNYAAVTADEHRQEGIRDAFVVGILSYAIRQRLLERENMTLTQILDRARSLETAQYNSEKFCIKQQGLDADNSVASAQQLIYEATKLSSFPTMQRLEADNCNICAASKLLETKCFYCGNKRHPRKDCPAKDSVRFKCKKQDHFAKVCGSRDARRDETTAML